MKHIKYSGLSYEAASREAERLIDRHGWYQAFDRLHDLREVMELRRKACACTKGNLHSETAEAVSASTYSSLDDWLNESEGYSIRAERVPVQALPWIKAAWELGKQSANAASEASAIMGRDD